MMLVHQLCPTVASLFSVASGADVSTVCVQGAVHEVLTLESRLLEHRSLLDLLIKFRQPSLSIFLSKRRRSCP